MDVGFWVLLALAAAVFVFLGPIAFFLTIGAQKPFRYLKNRIAVFITLPVRSLDQLSLANRLKQIGHMEGASHGEKAGS